MGNISENLDKVLEVLKDSSCNLIAVTKTQEIDRIMELYHVGFKIYGENKVQELCTKYESMPKDIEWHLIGHLQKNKVKYITPFVTLIHAVDSLDLLKEINKQALKHQRIQHCLLQIYIAKEETKFGLSRQELYELLDNEIFNTFTNVRIVGLMGMASNTDDQDQVRSEFTGLKELFEELKTGYFKGDVHFKELSMGMSGDYHIAIETGSTMIRVGSAIFGQRNYVV